MASAASLASVGGGVLSGSLHAISGPDHLAAVVPRCIGKRWWISMQVGALWGLGHGVSGLMMGLFAFLVKDKLNLNKSPMISNLSTWTEILVGLSLILIGFLGVKESRSFDSDKAAAKEKLEQESGKKTGSFKSIFFNGLLHGLSWDGTPSLAPALAFTTWRPVVGFLSAYCWGVVVSMSMCTSLIGEGSVRVGRDNPKIPQQLSMFSSGLAIVIGLLWTGKGILT
eukprot:CAMPEP_0113950770 /NCGR_PEP_ID=MMETSP1339-20121228/82493_1 /TAXON_ID=94617 /ORGANISM="Fibrocapsa japonica" /LENGTH=225 /DNA_ID=CAMNT_0000958737 /DNA_START=123 /DNA_END=800 /DNA_ORIENTATION=- /assembly_acc=CAM_ASM_000762